MDRFSLIVGVAVLAGAAGSAQAYVSPSPPAGFGGSPGAWTHTPPTATQQLGSIMRGPGPKIPGGPVTKGAFRLGAGAARALAGGIARGLIPGVGLALGVAWLASKCVEKQGGQWVLTCGGSTPPQSDGFEYRYSSGAVISSWSPSRQAACTDFVSLVGSSGGDVIAKNGVVNASGVCTYQTYWKTTGEFYQNSSVSPASVRPAANCPAGWYVTPAGCVQTPPPQVLTPEQIEEKMAPEPLPEVLPPGFPYPLDPLAPFIFEPDTATPPNPQPIWVPQGNPVPIPNTNPQQYRQPVTRFDPAPTTDDPFRLDARPEEIVGTSPTGMTSPQTGQSGQPPGEKPEQFDLCKEHPDIIACQVFKPDELEAKPVPNENRQLAITPDGGWGASSASCPADKTASLSFGPIAFSYEPLCLFASGIRPMVIALAWFSAALTFFGFARKDT
jgi:hypothetical protein